MIDVFSTMYDRIRTVSLIFALFHSFPYSYERTFNTSQSADERERTILLK
jgi:hypothetical protein